MASGKNTWLLMAAASLLLCSCHKLHWQRNKVRFRQQPQKPSIEVRVFNRTPYIFPETFAEDLRHTCEEEFMRMGYTLEIKDTPDYVAFIRVDMDSFPVTGVYVFGMGGPTSFWRPYKKDKVYAILFDYRIVNSRYKSTKWEERNDIYYFDNIERNSRRSRNMVKYTIRYGK